MQLAKTVMPLLAFGVQGFFFASIFNFKEHAKDYFTMKIFVFLYCIAFKKHRIQSYMDYVDVVRKHGLDVFFVQLSNVNLKKINYVLFILDHVGKVSRCCGGLHLSHVSDLCILQVSNLFLS